VTDPNRHALRLATAGIGVVGVTFGMARYGYGLLLPDIRRTFGLSPAALGLIGTGSYAGYLAATAATGVLASRVGPRATAVAAALIAAVAMAMAGLAPSAGAFAAAIVVAGAAAALSFAPIADAAAPLAPRTRRRVTAAVNCGTGYGVALAAPIAIVCGADWRAAWLAFAAVALIAAGWAARVLPRRAPTRSSGAAAGGAGAAATPAAVLRRPGAVPLLAGAVLVGAGSSAYWTFAVAHLRDAGDLEPSTTYAFLAVVGIAAVLGTGTGDLMRIAGARRAFALVTALEGAGIALLALAPAQPAAAFASAVLFGAAYNAAVGVQVIWSAELFADRPSLGVSAVMGAGGLGLMLGPAAAGALAGAIGMTTVLLIGAGIVVAAAAARPRARTPQAGAGGGGASPRGKARWTASATASTPSPMKIHSGSR
jgi:predicted MFS family arabinose efflux permease